MVVFLLGISALLYPVASNYLAEKNNSTAIAEYAEKVAELTPDERDAVWQAAERYNERLTGQSGDDPFRAGAGPEPDDDYENLLNLGGIMGYLDIPRIGVRLPIYHGTGEATLKRGLGHLRGSTLPIGGSPRHAVITGHTGLSSAKLLTDLKELHEGDQFYFHVLGEVLAYEVNRIHVIEPQRTDDLRRVADHDYATLLTCTPYGVNSHRLLVRGERVDFDPGARPAITPAVESATDRLTLYAAVATSALMLLLVATPALASRRREDDHAGADVSGERP